VAVVVIVVEVFIYLFILSFFLLIFEVFAILMLPSMCRCNGFLLEIHQFFFDKVERGLSYSEEGLQ
jgi:hypothetical protein